jgi:glycosyltransferase involved in cell wall biosynthesis
MKKNQIVPSGKFWNEKKLTILIPALNEKDNLETLIPYICESISDLKLNLMFKVLIIDDGSSDGTSELIENKFNHDDRVSLITLRSNVGKSLALNIGLRSITSDYLITMDADHQDDAVDIVKFLCKLESGYELVCGSRLNRSDTSFRKVGSKIFNWALIKSSNLKLADFNCGFKGYSKDLYSSLVVYGHYHRFIPFIASLNGFNIDEVQVRNNSRLHGQSKYKALRYEGLFDLLSLIFIHKYGLNPLHFFGKISALIAIPSLIVIFYFTISQIFFWLGFGDAFMVENRPLILFSTGGLLFSLIILMTGFVCDFFLHHIINDRMASIMKSTIKIHNDKN